MPFFPRVFWLPLFLVFRKGFQKNVDLSTFGWVGGSGWEKILKKDIMLQLFTFLGGGVRPGTESSSTLYPHMLSQPHTTVTTITHHCQPTRPTLHL